MDNHQSLELADVFRAGFELNRKQTPLLPREHYAAAGAIMACHTATLGGHVYRCEDCGHDVITYNSCRNRHCPSCQASGRAQWVRKRLAELLPVPYFHVVFTLPDALNPFALRNKECVYNILFRSVSETMHDIAADPRHLGALQGFFAVLHTWGQALLDHPHIHLLVPAGGLDITRGVWKAAPRPDYLFPVHVLSALFRGKFMQYFRNALDSGEICFHGSLGRYQQDPSLLKKLIDDLYKATWNVYSEPPFSGPEAVVKYLARYINRIAISNQRLISLTDTHIRFRWKDYADNGVEKIMTLPLEEFIRRFFLHVLPTGFVRIRYYGFLCPSMRKKLAQCMEILGRPVTNSSTPAPTWSELIAALNGIDPFICPYCCRGKLKVMRRIDHMYRKGVHRRLA